MKIGRIALSLMAGMVLAVLPARALTVGSNAEYTVETVASGTATEQDGPYSAGSGSVDSHVTFGGGLEAATSDVSQVVEFGSFGEANAFSSAGGTLAANTYLLSESDVSSMDFHAFSSWSDDVTNNTGGTATYDFEFAFDGGRLSLDGTGGMAMFNLDILLNGNSVWSRSASLYGNPSVAPPMLSTNLLHFSMFESGNYIDIDFDPFTGNLDLGPFAAGETFSLTYNLEVWASTDSMFGYVESRVGDPFSGGFSGSLSAPISNPIPEPATMALLGMGVAGLVARQVRGKK